MYLVIGMSPAEVSRQDVRLSAGCWSVYCTTSGIQILVLVLNRCHGVVNIIASKALVALTAPFLKNRRLNVALNTISSPPSRIFLFNNAWEGSDVLTGSKCRLLQSNIAVWHAMFGTQCA